MSTNTPTASTNAPTSDSTSIEAFVRSDLFRAILRTQHADLLSASTTAAKTVPTGAILPFSVETAPEGWLLCNGQEVYKDAYSALYAVIADKYGTPVDTLKFQVPDLRGRMPVGIGLHSDVSTLGNSESKSVSDRRPKHQHTVYDTGHTHTFSGNTGDNIGGNTRIMQDHGNTGNVGWVEGTNMLGQQHIHSFSGTTSGPGTPPVTVNPLNALTDTSSPVDTPAFLVVNYIIRT